MSTYPALARRADNPTAADGTRTGPTRSSTGAFIDGAALSPEVEDDLLQQARALLEEGPRRLSTKPQSHPAGARIAAKMRNLTGHAGHRASGDAGFVPMQNCFPVAAPLQGGGRHSSESTESPVSHTLATAAAAAGDGGNTGSGGPVARVTYVRMTPIQMRKLLASRGECGARPAGAQASAAPPMLDGAVGVEALLPSIARLREVLKLMEAQTPHEASDRDAGGAEVEKTHVTSEALAELRALHEQVGQLLCKLGVLPSLAAEVRALTGVEPSLTPHDRGILTPAKGGGRAGGGFNRTSSMASVGAEAKTLGLGNRSITGGSAAHRNSGVPPCSSPTVKIHSAPEEEAGGGSHEPRPSMVHRFVSFTNAVPAADTHAHTAVVGEPSTASVCSSDADSSMLMGDIDGASVADSTVEVTTNGQQRSAVSSMVSVMDDDDGDWDDEMSVEAEMAELRFERTLGEVDNIMADAEQAYKGVQDFANNMIFLMQSWVGIANESFEEFSVELFTLMVQDHPGYKDLFYGKDLREQARIFGGMLNRAVVTFARPENMLELMTEMGARHCLYGVGEEHFIAMRDTFFKVYPNYVSKEMYDKSINIWYIFWKWTIGLLSHGSRSDRAKYYEKRRREEWIKLLQRGLKVLMPLQRAEPDSERKHLFVVHMFDVALKADPSMALFERLRDSGPSDRTSAAIGRIINNLGNDKKIRRYCADLANRHINYGITPEHFAFMKGPFLETVEYFLKDQPILTPHLMHAFADYWDYMVEIWTPDLRLKDNGGLETVTAPDGTAPFAILFTDIEASTKLWESNPTAMKRAVAAHHTIVRGLISDYGGYEVKTVGDSFMVATKDPLIALHIGLAIQLEMMRKPITSGFSMKSAVPEPQGGGDPNCWRDDSIRVRVGIHYSKDASAVYDGVHRRFDYYGPAVNCAARVEAAACGGEILMSQEAVDALKDTGFYTEPHPPLLDGNGIGPGIADRIASLLADEAVATGAGGTRSPSQPAMDSDELAQSSSEVSGGGDTRSTYCHSHKSEAFLARPLSDLVVFNDLGEMELKGIAGRQHILSALPYALRGRAFARERGAPAAGQGAAAGTGSDGAEEAS